MQNLSREGMFECLDHIRDCISLSDLLDCKQCLEIAVNPLLEQQILRGSEVMSLEEFMKYGGGDTGFQEDVSKKFKVIMVKAISIEDKTEALCAMKAISLSTCKTLIIAGKSLEKAAGRYNASVKDYIESSGGTIKNLQESLLSDSLTEMCIAIISKRDIVKKVV